MSFVKKNITVIIIGIVFFSLLFNYYNYNKRLKLLQNSNEIIGIMIKEYSKGKSGSGTFKFKINEKKYVFREIADFSDIFKGDTVLIEYAVEDPTVARVKDKYYMQKYKQLRKKY